MAKTIKIKTTLASKINNYKPGDVITIDDATADDLIAAGHAELYAGDYKIKNDTNNPLAVDPNVPELSIPAVSLSATGVLFTQDVGKFPFVNVQVTSAGTTCTITYEQSNDGATWNTVIMSDSANSATGGTNNSSTIGNFSGYISAKYFRARVSTYTSGTVTASMIARNIGTYSKGVITVLGAGADSSPINGFPVLVAGAVRTSIDTTLVAGDVATLEMTTSKQLVFKEFAPAELDWQYATPIASPITNTTAVAVKAAAGAGIRNFVTGFTAANSSAVASVITIQDGSTVIYTDYVPAGGRLNVQFLTPLKGSANAAINVVVNTTGTNTFVALQGFIGI